MSRIDEVIQAKKQKRQELEKRSVVIHPYSFDKQHSVAFARQNQGQKIKTAGRIMSVRTHGSVIFLDLRDDTDSIQVMLRKDEVGEDKFKLFSFIDAGDFLGVEGEVVTTKAGEITIKANSYTFLGKSLRSIPSQWNAAENKEARFRKRYLDILINEKTKKVLDARWLIIKELRRYLEDEHHFTEVETPVFQPLYGGTNATPFVTHMKALDSDFYLRIAPELYLKRLVVAGYEKIYEIARNFRNEGIDQTHQPEFTMIEWYETYADYNRMMDVAEGLIKHLTQKLHGTQTVKVGQKDIDISEKWRRITMTDSFKEYLQIDFDSLSDQEIKDLMTKHQVEIVGEFTRGKAMFALFDKLIPPFLIEPTWVIDYPRDVSPLSKVHRQNSQLAERYEAYIGGKELADGWSEIVDPLDQRQIFENEQKRMRAGDEEAHPLDEDFLEAMEYGMPPLGGIGIGIDRLVMFLTNTWSIKEVIAFPTLRPQRQPELTASTKPTNPQTKKNEGVVKKKPSLASLPPREQAEQLLTKYIKNQALQKHCQMVAKAMAAYAEKLGEDEELWYQTGLLHDLDWEMYPDEHPNKALAEILTDYPQELRDAIASHAPDRTGKHPQTILEKYLFACDEISGFMNAVALMRPNGFSDMKPKSVKKKLKDKSFAAQVNREDITQGFELINKDPDDHISFLIEVFKT